MILEDHDLTRIPELGNRSAELTLLGWRANIMLKPVAEAPTAENTEIRRGCAENIRGF